MPSHIFTRLGYWDESIEMNRRSAELAPVGHSQAVHAYDYMVYAYLQEGRDAAALDVIRNIRSDEDPYYGGIMNYNAIAMPARYALERGDWEAAAALPAPEDALAYVEAIPRFGAYSDAFDEMLARSSTEWAPWHVIRGNDKLRARLSATPGSGVSRGCFRASAARQSRRSSG